MLDYTALKSKIDNLNTEGKYAECVILIQNQLHEFDGENKVNLLSLLINCYEQLNDEKNASNTKIELSLLHNELKNNKKSIDILNSINTDDKAILAESRFILGFIYKQSNDYDHAIKSYLSVERKDSKEYYAMSRINLALLYEEINEFKNAEEAYLSITREDSKEYYAKSRSFLGITYKNNKDYDNAIKTYLSVEREDSKEYYLMSRISLALTYESKNEFKNAEKTYLSITREDSKEYYSKSRYYLSFIYKKNKDYDNAISTYLSVEREDSKEYYARSMFLLGLLYDEREDYHNAIKTLLSVEREDSKEYYAKSMFFLGLIYNKKRDSKNTIQKYLSVKREDSKEYYAKARLYLGNLYNKNNDYNNAIPTYLSINITDNAEIYAQSQLKLAEHFAEKSDLTEDDLQRSIQHLSNIKQEHSPELYSYCTYKLHIFKKIILQNNKNNFIELFNLISEIKSVLLINNPQENLIAHYTNPDVAKKILANDICSFKKFSYLRLNTTDHMNDPKEGVILQESLGINHDFKSSNDKPFIGCFTFHHDSLNQFRLYGKDKTKEASGVSLVIDNEYFNPKSTDNNIRILEINDLANQFGNSQEKTTLRSENNESNHQDDHSNLNHTSNALPEEQSTPKLGFKLPLYRCIYLDPDSGLLKVAHREEWTFCRQEKNRESQNWSNYYQDIQRIELACRTTLDSIQDTLKPLMTIYQSDPAKNIEIIQLISEIFLPLQYLIKHMAFKEEQECRIVYITQWDDSHIQYDEDIKRFYIDYGHDMVKYLKKIYLAPFATPERSMFEYITTAAKKNMRTTFDVQIKNSHNPFRQ